LLEIYKIFKAQTAHQILVAVEDEKVIGFACFQPYRESEAFAATVELTIYLASAAKSRGAGSALYGVLFDKIAFQNVHRALSGIALLNQASIALHQKFGFSTVGVSMNMLSRMVNTSARCGWKKCFHPKLVLLQLYRRSSVLF